MHYFTYTKAIVNMHRIHSFFDHVYLLCEKPRPYQKLIILQKLQRLQIQVCIVEGNHKSVLKNLYAEILLHAQEKAFDQILILKDDISFHKDFHSQFDQQIASLPPKWKILHLGMHQFKAPRSHEGPARKLGAFAVGLHRSTFQHLLLSLGRLKGSIDSVHFQSIILNHPDQCISFEPQLVVSEMINKLKDDHKTFSSLCNQFKWHIESFDYPFEPDLVSIIMPAYNRAEMIEKAILSTLRQSYSAFELIVIDDASTDGTVAVVKRLMTTDKRIHLIQRTENGGVGKARNDGIRHAKGRFIAFHDSDDIMFKDRLTRQLLPFYKDGVLTLF